MRIFSARSKDTSRLIKGLTTKISETEEAIKTVTAEIAASAPEGANLLISPPRPLGACQIYIRSEA